MVIYLHSCMILCDRHVGRHPGEAGLDRLQVGMMRTGSLEGFASVYCFTVRDSWVDGRRTARARIEFQMRKLNCMRRVRFAGGNWNGERF